MRLQETIQKSAETKEQEIAGDPLPSSPAIEVGINSDEEHEDK